MKKRIEITLDEELYNWLDSLKCDTRQLNNSKLIEYLLLNYLIYKYKPLDIEVDELISLVTSKRKLNKIEIDNILKRVQHD